MFKTKTADQIMSGFTKVFKELEQAAVKAQAEADREEAEAAAARQRAEAAKDEVAKATKFKAKLEALFA